MTDASESVADKAVSEAMGDALTDAKHAIERLKPVPHKVSGRAKKSLSLFVLLCVLGKGQFNVQRRSDVDIAYPVDRNAVSSTHMPRP